QNKRCRPLPSEEDCDEQSLKHPEAIHEPSVQIYNGFQWRGLKVRAASENACATGNMQTRTLAQGDM
ncbi:MAG TPA: hypothetical protein VFX22_12405, partial [Candidatus Kapabacteria bacterium]|nr:hypothetical protein [Candidatus Kapabacteria bacterium]